MFVLITYDIATGDRAGRRRLRKVAQACLDWGKRVQFSVFECDLNAAQWVEVRAKILGLMDESLDSVRFYILDRAAKKRIEHHGVREPVDLEGPLVI